MLYNHPNLRRLITAAIVLALWGCNDYGTNCPPGEYCDCPPPYDSSFGPYIPEHWHTGQKLSPDGRTLGFLTGGVTVRLLDLQNGQIRTIDVWNRLPENVQLIGCANYAWCPYDNNRLLLHCVTATDTVGDGKHYQYGHNLYITSIDGTEFQRVTPMVYGMSGLYGGIELYSWLQGSSRQQDSLLCAFHNSNGGGYQEAVYIPQHQQFSSNMYKGLLRQRLQYTFAVDPYFTPSGSPEKLLLNNQEIQFKNAILRLDYASWSPDGRKLALSVLPYSQGNVYSEVWIVDVERFLREKPAVVPVEVINFQRKFCTYNRWGSHAEFITDSTLAVSMHGDLEKMSALWEITLDGRKKRQLTFEP